MPTPPTRTRRRFFADYKPTNWLTARGSFSYGLRRSENYNYLQNVGLFQWPGLPLGPRPTFTRASIASSISTTATATTAKLLLDIALSPTVTLTPTIGYRDDWYRIDPSMRARPDEQQVWSARESSSPM